MMVGRRAPSSEWIKGVKDLEDSEQHRVPTLCTINCRAASRRKSAK
jgi:hypothetical protein